MNAKAVIKNIVHKGKAAVSKAQKPKVVVIVPVYNVEKYLPDCKASLDAQTEQDFSVIAVDDGSTDGSGAFLDVWAKADKRVTVIHQPNAGLGAARNTALNWLEKQYQRDGDKDYYIVFLDSDDMLEPDTVKHVQDTMFELSLDICEFECRPLFETEELEAKNVGLAEWLRMHGDYREPLSGPEYMERQGVGDQKSSAWFRAYRAGYLFEEGLRFPEGVLHEDVAFAFTSVLRSQRAACLHEQLYVYRIRQDAITTSPRSYENLKGRFVGELDMLQELARHPELTPTQAHVAQGIVEECIKSNYADYVTLNADLIKEQAEADLNPAEQFLFFKLLVP